MDRLEQLRERVICNLASASDLNVIFSKTPCATPHSKTVIGQQRYTKVAWSHNAIHRALRISPTKRNTPDLGNLDIGSDENAL